MTIRDRVRQWLGLDELEDLNRAGFTVLGLKVDESIRITQASGEWAAQSGLAIQALEIQTQLSDLNAKLDKLTDLIEPQAPKFIRAVPRVLSFEAAQFEDLAASIEKEKERPNGRISS